MLLKSLQHVNLVRNLLPNTSVSRWDTWIQAASYQSHFNEIKYVTRQLDPKNGIAIVNEQQKCRGP